MAITDKKGINVTSGFKLVSANPLDARFIAVDETDLQSLIDNGAVYNGLEVWVDSLGKKLIYNGTEFVEISAGSVEVPAPYVENETLYFNGTPSTGGGNTSGGNSGNTKKVSITFDPSVNIPNDQTSWVSIPLSSEQQEILKTPLLGADCRTTKILGMKILTSLTTPDNIIIINDYVFNTTYNYSEVIFEGNPFMKGISSITGICCEPGLTGLIGLSLRVSDDTFYISLHSTTGNETLENILTLISLPNTPDEDGISGTCMLEIEYE